MLNVPPRQIIPTVPTGQLRMNTQKVIIPQDLVLRPHQIDWANKAKDILLRNHGYIDTSRMRCGKTLIVLWLAKIFGFTLIVICPVTVIANWEKEAKTYGVPYILIISYQTLRSKRNHQPSHGYLYRHDTLTQGGLKQTSFVATKDYLEFVQKGVFVIFDEMQYIKNNSAQHKACSALLKPIINGGRSRFACLSGTPFDKEEHATNLLRFIGYISSQRMYYVDPHSRKMTLEGIQELIDACKFINPKATDEVVKLIPPSKGQIDRLAHTLYVRVIKAHISGAMPPPTNPLGKLDLANGFYNVSEEVGKALVRAVALLAESVNYDERTGTANLNNNNIGAVTIALMEIEKCKILLFRRLVVEALTRTPELKIVISVNYTETIKQLATLLDHYNPLILNGQIPPKKRGVIIEEFNTNPNKHLIIMNAAVGGVGISLSVNGTCPIIMFQSSSYKLLEMIQGAFRILDDNSPHLQQVRVVYAKGNGRFEMGVYRALSRKTVTLKDTLEELVIRNITLPGDYPSIIEP
jgi:hypothetical protein